MNGFLDTEGRLHECEPYGHLDMARTIVAQMGISLSYRNPMAAEDYLQKQGWVVIRTRDVYGLIGQYKDSFGSARYHLTSAQKEWLNNAYSEMLPECRESVERLLDWDK